MIAYYQDTHDPALRRCVALVLVNKSEALGQLGSFEEAVAVFDELVAGFADDSIEAFDGPLRMAVLVPPHAAKLTLGRHRGILDERSLRAKEDRFMAGTVSGPQGPIEPELRAERPIDPNARIGHVHLRTADIDRVRDFYVGILGFDVVHEARGVPGWGTKGDILFVSAGGYHHHLAFNTWKSADGPPQPDGVAGLHHVALNFSSQAELAEAVGRLVDAGIPLRQLTDHGTHLAVYLSDPDGNDLELAWDRPFEQWRRYGSDDAPPNDGRLELDELLNHRG